MPRREILQGNWIVAEAAIAAGCRFYAGYPITPSSELAARIAEKLPHMGGVFIQMEDEIASMGAIIGASCCGVKSMTATSGPGFSLKQENIGFAAMAEIPCVIVNVMRTGPSTGLPTRPSQGDVMQAKWGTHGDHPIIVLAPSFPREVYLSTIRAFNLSEKFRNPVIILLDEVLGHSFEVVDIPDSDEYEIMDRERPPRGSNEFNYYDREPGKPPVVPDFFTGYSVHIESLEHDDRGMPTNAAENVKKQQFLRLAKIEKNLDEILEWKEHYLDDAEIMIFAFGTSARASLEAIKELREEGIKIGLFQPITIWPFPERPLAKKLEKIKKVLVVEMNMGQIIYEVERTASDDVRIDGLFKVDGTSITPIEIINKVKELYL
ncbi:MAG: 2-oxoacid:acceptor oxidoreductase subunit alpha [Acidobacteriota bacterium]